MTPSSTTAQSYPMSIQSVDPLSGTTWVDLGEGHKVTVQAAAPVVQREQSLVNGALVAHTETREMLTPVVTMPQRTGGSSRVEDLQPIVTTRAYETIRRDVSEVFPGSNIVAVLPPQQAITTPLGGTYTAVTRGFDISSPIAAAASSTGTTVIGRGPGGYAQTIYTQPTSFSPTSGRSVLSAASAGGVIAGGAPTSAPTYNISTTSTVSRPTYIGASGLAPSTPVYYSSTASPIQKQQYTTTTSTYESSPVSGGGGYVLNAPVGTAVTGSLSRLPASSPVYSPSPLAGGPTAYSSTSITSSQRLGMM